MSDVSKELLPDLDGATPEQIMRANAAVEANLDNGVPIYDSAQGYACALTAIMQSDTRAQPAPADVVERVESALTLELSRQSVNAGILDGYNPRLLAKAAIEAMGVSDEVVRLRKYLRRIELGAFGRDEQDRVVGRLTRTAIGEIARQALAHQESKS